MDGIFIANQDLDRESGGYNVGKTAYFTAI